MQLAFDPADLKPIVAAVVAELSDRLAPMDHRLAVSEREGAALIGLHWDQLRDCRRRGEIRASKVGKAWLYRRETLVRFLLDREREK